MNLVRRSAYDAAGGHAAIRMRIDDDLRLGRLVKERGGRSAFVFARDLVSVEWYPSLRAMVRGLEKNAFAGNCLALTLDDLFFSAVAWRTLAPEKRRCLQDWGFRIHAVELDEIEKAGGSLRCCIAEIF